MNRRRLFVCLFVPQVDRSDRSFRKACRRMDAVLQQQDDNAAVDKTNAAAGEEEEQEQQQRRLRLSVHTGEEVTKALVGNCMRCRNIWERRRAADRSDADAADAAAAGAAAGGGGEQRDEEPAASGDSSVQSGRRSAKPPPKRNYYLSSLMSKRLLKDGRPNPDVALFVITRDAAQQPPPQIQMAHTNAVEGSEPEPEPETQPVAAGLVAGYLLTERVGRTIVSVDGVHDYSVSDARADPSAWLLHVAAKWWSGEGRGDGGVAPVWLNDGPVPTPGLLRYKSQYHGELQQLLALKVA